MGYKVGDMVVYPRHGAAKVEAITERTVKGVTREYLQLSVLSSDGLVINVPVENAKKVGVRDIVGAKEVAKVFEILRTPIIEKEMNWSRRYKLNVEKIATGDVNKIPCNHGTGSADGNQAILAIPATDSGPVQPT